MELAFAFQELLSRLEFVSLPGIGSFVKKYNPAWLSADGKTFNPPREYYVFDTSRTFNDDAIESYICETPGVTHEEASAAVSQFVQQVKDCLGRGDEFLFEGIGVLKQNVDGTIALTPAEEVMSQTYGLCTVDVLPNAEVSARPTPTVRVQKVDVKPPVKSTISSNSKSTTENKSKWPIAVLGLVLVAVIGIVAVIYYVPGVRFWEKKSLSKNIKGAIDQPLAPAGKAVAVADSVGTVNDTSKNVSNTATSVDSVASKPDDKLVVTATSRKSALYYQEATPAENKTFYIIAGSFSQEENAQKLIRELSVKGYRPILLQNDNMYRVAIYKFTSRDRAVREMERIKAQNIGDHIWLLGI